MLRVHRSLAHSDDYSAPVGDQVKGVFGKIQEKLASSKLEDGSTSNASAGSPPSSSTTTCSIATNQHAAGKIALSASQSMENEELGRKLAWYGSLMEDLGGNRLLLAQRIQIKGRRPLKNVLDVLFEQTSAARKDVFMTRLTLDSLKRSSPDGRTPELTTAEEHYNNALSKSKACMQSILDSQILATALRDMIEVLKEYHRQCLEVLEGAL